MLRRFFAVLCGVVLITSGFTPVASAGLMLSLELDDPSIDLGNLNIGDTVRINVKLTDIGDSPTGSLDALRARVDFDASLFGTPELGAGGIVPDPHLTFLNFSFPGIADGAFDNFPGPVPEITTDGTFYSFSVKALRAGSGEFAFSTSEPPSGLSGDGSPILDPINTPAPLNFAIQSAGGRVVPEPSSALVWGSVLVTLGVVRRRSRSRSKRC